MYSHGMIMIAMVVPPFSHQPEWHVFGGAIVSVIIVPFILRLFLLSVSMTRTCQTALVTPTRTLCDSVLKRDSVLAQLLLAQITPVGLSL